MVPDEIVLPELVLRPWRLGDVAAVLQALTDPDIVRWSAPGLPADLAAARRWILGRVDPSDGSRACWAVVDRSTGALVGSVAINHIDLDAEDAEVGYWTLPEARGRGVATAAVRAAADWIFGNLRVHRLELCHAVENETSCRVAAKSGFQYEGTLRDAMRYADGRWHDEHLHARLATDHWPRYPHAR